MKLLWVTALVVKFVNKLKSTVRTKSNSVSGAKLLTALELTSAEELWIMAVQASSFDEEIKFLHNHRQNKTVLPAYVSQFGLFLENDIVKCKGRRNNAELLGSARNPILLPAKHDFVPSVIKKVHASVKHCGLRDTHYDKRAILDLERSRSSKASDQKLRDLFEKQRKCHSRNLSWRYCLAQKRFNK